MTDYETSTADSLVDDAPIEVLAALGPLLQRIGRAVGSTPGVARTHFARWGDGSEHLRIVASSLAEGGGKAFPQATEIS